MGFVGIVGVILGLLSFAWMTRIRNNRNVGLFVLMASGHVATAVIYYFYVQSNDADTKLYYFDTYGFFNQGFALGTLAIVYVTQTMRQALSGTYLDYFLFYQAFGIWGLALVYRMFEDLSLIVDHHLTPTLIALLFLPGMYFWTSAIGKDAPMFFASALAVWSAFAIARRWPFFLVAIAIMVVIRPHVALISVAALALALVTGRGVSVALRVLLFGLAIASVGALVGTIQSELQIDVTSASSISGFVEKASNAAGEGGEDSLAEAAFPIKLLSVLYRPLFIDTNGLFGLVASVQNLAMIWITIQLARNFGVWRQLFRASFPIRFATIHFVGIFVMLALIFYNVGLGLRQREMATPALLVVFAAVTLVANRRAFQDRIAIAKSALAPAI